MINNHIASSELVGFQSGIGIAVVGACFINLAYGWLQIVHIPLHYTEDRIVAAAVSSASLLPAATLTSQIVGRHDVFPFYPVGPGRILIDFVAAFLKICPGHMSAPV